MAALPSSCIKLIAHMRLDSAAGRRLVAASLTSRLEALQLLEAAATSAIRMRAREAGMERRIHSGASSCC